MRSLPFVILFTFYSVVSHCQYADTLVSNLHALIGGYEQVYGFTGTVKVVLGEQEVFEQSYGWANRSFEIPNTPDTRFSINSISKTFTAVAILQLAAAGDIDLQEPVSTYLPELDASWKDSITVHHLLSHTSGLPRESGIQWYDELSLQDQVPLVAEQELLFSPGARYGYSNAGLILLGAILEQVSGMEYQAYMEERVLRPINLPNTGVYNGRLVVPNQAVPYRFTANGLEFAPRAKHYGENAGGGLYSTPGDLYRYVLALEANKLLPAEYTELLFSPQIESGEGEYEAYAWSLKSFGAEQIRFAAGSGYGTKSVIIRMPESGDFIGITSNWGNTPILQMLGDVFLLIRGEDVRPPAGDELADPAAFSDYLGTYRFDPDELRRHLMMENPILKLHAFEGKLFLNDELLARKGEGVLGLTYTDELTIEFQDGRMIIMINGNRLESR